jgi:DNA-binding transcriptional LysR family regulator
MDRLDAMAAFVAVAELHGFKAAGQRLGLSPSAVTRLIAALEERLGIRLLQRTTRSVTLTNAGSRYLERARRILADVREAEGAAQAEQLTPTGRFVVSAPNVFGRLNVTPVMCTYLSRYPEVSGELILSDRIVNLIDDGVDVAVRIGALDDSTLFARKVGATRRVVVASPQYLAQRGEPRRPRDLDSHDIVSFTAVSPGPEWRFPSGQREDRVTFTPRFATNSADAAISHVLRGGGLTMVLAYQVIELVRAGKLSVVLSGAEPPPLPIHVVHPSTRLLSANVRAFVDLVVSECDWQFIELQPPD